MAYCIRNRHAVLPLEPEPRIPILVFRGDHAAVAGRKRSFAGGMRSTQRRHVVCQCVPIPVPQNLTADGTGGIFHEGEGVLASDFR